MTGAMDVDHFQDVQIFDERGVNVTPKSLAHLAEARKPATRGKDAGGIAFGAPLGSGPAAASAASAGAAEAAGSDAAAPIGSEVVLDPELLGETEAASSDVNDAAARDDETRDATGATDATDATDATAPRVIGVGPGSTEPEPELALTLTESDTFVLFRAPGRVVPRDDPAAEALERRGAAYGALLARKVGSEAYVDASAQTLNAIRKEKLSQSAVVTRTERASQCAVWETSRETRFGADGEKAVTSAGAGAASGADARDAEASVSGAEMTLGSGLRFVEKAILQNLYQDKMLLYRAYRVADVGPARGEAGANDANDAGAERPAAANPETHSQKHALVHLWDFICDETRGRDVSCVAWNALAPDALAVGYGLAEPAASGGERRGERPRRDGAGLVAFWSLKNPEHPEWTFATPSGVTALDFSPTEPNLLAVGTHDGAVSVYDASTTPRARAPFLSSGGGVPGKHSDPVWQVRWDRTRASCLVSISTDGRVTQWKLQKGLEHVDLMRLTRVARRPGAASASAAKPAEPTISRRGAGTCFDFSRADPTTYVAGTEEGVLHKCSSAYSEQYLRTYHGHSGPVHRAAWSPFARDVFASASADWTTKLWRDNEESAALTLQSGRGVDVTDVAWSPTDATVLATGSLDGGLDVWDLAVSTLAPAVSAAVAGGKLACVAFSESSPVIVAGGGGGFVGVYRLVGARDGARDEGERLEAAMGGSA